MVHRGSRSFSTEVPVVGIQGSGLINGWYLRPRSGTVVLYQFGGWDVFEEYLGPLGNYRYWVNGDEARSFCNRTSDPYCDSPDTEVDVSEAVAIVSEALATSRAHCDQS